MREESRYVVDSIMCASNGVLMPAVLVLARRLELVPHVALEALEPADELLLDIAGGVQRLTHKRHRLLTYCFHSSRCHSRCFLDIHAAAPIGGYRI